MIDKVMIGGGLKKHSLSLSIHTAATSENIQWSYLPSHVLELICNRLNYGESIRFGAVCKEWQEAAENYEMDVDHQHPFLSIHVAGGMCHFHSVRNRESFSKFKPAFRYGSPLSTSHGWFLLEYNRDDGSFLNGFHLYNPYDDEARLISLSPCPTGFARAGHILRPPSAPGGFMVVMDKGEGHLSIIRSFDIGGWRELSSPSSDICERFINIVQIGNEDKLLYGLDMGGSLFTIDVCRGSITKLPVPTLKSYCMYLLESAGVIYAVLRFYNRKKNGKLNRYRPVKFKVFQLDLPNSTWVRLDDLGERVALHVSNSYSTLVRTRQGMGNRIYFVDTAIHRRQRHYWNVYNMKIGSVRRGPKFDYDDVYELSWFTPLRI